MWNLHFNMRALQKKETVDNYQIGKKILFVSPE